MERCPIDPARACIDRYRELEEECRFAGVSQNAVNISRKRDSRKIGPHFYLRVHAFKPTGVALGCPLPDPGFERSLCKLCFSVDHFLAELTGSRRTVFSLVPAAFYHVTLVNRDHFEFKGDNARVQHITRGEKTLINKTVAAATAGRVIQIRFSRLLLTTTGRLMVPGYPVDGRLFRLRSMLHDSVASLGCNLPKTAHIKIGHVLTTLSVQETAEFYSWTKQESKCRDSVLSFRDVYTPIGRIRF